MAFDYVARACNVPESLGEPRRERVEALLRHCPTLEREFLSLFLFLSLESMASTPRLT